MARTHTVYTPEEKKEIICSILSKKTSIQKIAKAKNIAPTLVSLWKKQAEDAIFARFQPQPRGRRKAVPTKAEEKADVRALKNEARKAKTRVKRLEASLKAARERVTVLEEGIHKMAEAMGCRMVKAHQPRRTKKHS
ncbi:MAG: transposase [Akkermansia sp.]|nr:transposase [Akkermansia sp.]